MDNFALQIYVLENLIFVKKNSKNLILLENPSRVIYEANACAS